jgi:hypothetical protein
LKAQREAEAQGLVFFSQYSELVAGAKKEGRLRFLLSEEPRTIHALIQAFRERHPFIDAHGEETSGSDAGQRFVLELEAGQASKWDSGLIHLEWYTRYLPQRKKLDILGMAQEGILNLPVQMIDPGSRRFILATSDVTAIVYNRCILQGQKVPDR